MSVDRVMNIAHAEVINPSHSNQAPAASSIEALDQTVLAALAEAQEEGEPDLVVELIDLYLDDAPQWVEAIRTAVARADTNTIRRAAHTLKGSSGSVGVRQVAEICKIFEQMDLTGSASSGETLLQILDREFERAHTALLSERDRRVP